MGNSKQKLKNRGPSLPKASRANVLSAIWEIIIGDEGEHLTQKSLSGKFIFQGPQVLSMLYFLKLLDKPGIRRVDVLVARKSAKDFSRLLKARVIAEYPKLLSSDDPALADQQLAKQLDRFGTNSFEIPSHATTQSSATGCLKALNEVVFELGNQPDGFKWLARLADSYKKVNQSQDSQKNEPSGSRRALRSSSVGISPEGRGLASKVLKFPIKRSADGTPEYAVIEFDRDYDAGDLSYLIHLLKDRHDELFKSLKSRTS